MKKIFAKVLGAAALTVMAYSCAPEEDNTAAPTSSDPKQKWIGTWKCAEQSTKLGSVTPYDVHFVDSAGSSAIKMENFYGLGFQNKTIGIINNSSITINNQTVSAFNIHGSGTMNSNTSVSMTYYVDDGSSIDTCNATFTKQ